MENKTNQQRTGLWQADIGSVLVLVGFVIVLFLVETWLEPEFNWLTLLITGFAIALFPAIVWLGFFYRKDRLNPEPEKLVLQVFILGGLLANAIGIPLLEDIYLPQNWLSENPPWSILLGGILVIGFSQEFLKYAAVRYSVYRADDFDERLDGIVYATAAGLGYATVLNIGFVVNSGGVNLGFGSIHIVLTALAHASFAGITGYFLSRQKFENKSVWWMPLGVSIAALLNGLFFFLRGAVLRSATSFSAVFDSQWYGLIMAAVLALVVTWFLSRSMRRDSVPGLKVEED